MASLPLSFLQFVELAVVLGIVRVLLKAFKVEPVDLIPGPLSPSWLYGTLVPLILIRRSHFLRQETCASSV